VKTPKVVDAVLCEAARQEINGRFTLLGAFGGDLRIKELPGMVQMALFAEIDVQETGQHNADFRVRHEGGKTLLSANMSSSFDQIGHSSIAIGSFPLPVESEGVHRFQWKFEGGKWETIKALRIELDPNIPVPSTGTISTR
jgi:hypothetical protein